MGTRQRKEHRSGVSTLQPPKGFGAIFAAAALGTGNGMLVTDVTRPEKPIVFANPAFERLTGYTLAEILGRNCRLLRGPGTDVAAAEKIDRSLAEGNRLAVEILNYRKDGAPFWNELTLTPVRHDGRVTHFVEILIDVTQRHLAEERARASEEKLKDFAEAASDWLWESGADLRFTYFSGKLLEITGIDPARLIGKRREDLLSEQARCSEAWSRHLEDLRACRPFRDFVYKLDTPAGVKRTVRVSGRPYYASDGHFLGYRGTGSDITHQIDAEQRAQRAERRLMEAMEAMPASVTLWDANDRAIFTSERSHISHLIGEGRIASNASFEDMMRGLAAAGRYAYQGEELQRFIQARIEGHRKAENAMEIPLDDGRWLYVVEKRLSDGSSIKCTTEITELRRREAHIAEQSRLLETTFESIDQGIAVFDMKQTLIASNDRHRLLLDYPAELVRNGRNLKELVLHAAERGDYGPGDPHELANRYLAQREKAFGKRRVVHRASGISLEFCSYRTPDGGSVTLIADVTERVRAERMRDSDRQILECIARGDSLGSVLEALCLAVESFATGMKCAVMLRDGDRGQFRLAAGGSLPAEMQTALTTAEIEPDSGPPGATPGRQASSSLVVSSSPLWPGLRNEPTAAAIGSYWSAPITGGNASMLGTIDLYLASSRDPSEHDREVIEHATYLAQIAVDRALGEERQQQLKERLRHAQKLQALGTLVGGIAHEINNALLPIMTFGEMVRDALPEGGFERDGVAQMVQSAQQIENLIKRVRDHSREEAQALDTQLDLAGFVARLLKALRAAIPKNIELVEVVEPDIGAVHAGEEKLKQVFTDLVSNAAHAIGAEPGRIEISARADFDNAASSHAGGGNSSVDYVRLSVKDDGPGIPPIVRERLFEPFFITKAAGSGVGLGLYTARRVVTELGGYLDVESEPGQGACFSVYLPRASARGDRLQHA
ncbi:MAG: PAS-domain containing protein [Proteobacteria bacterium]|nr:PAS-domain containing protein [Pseudomonadota bacterium]